MYSVKKVA